jgi:hypothetical protein
MLHWFQKVKDSQGNSRARKDSSAGKASRPRNRSIGFESLEGRQMLSGGPWAHWGFGFGFGGLGAFFGSQSANSQSTGSTTTTTTTQTATATPVLTVSNASPFYGQNVTLTATVGPASGSSVTVTGGLVQFSDGSTVIGTARLRNGVATLTVGDLAVSTTAHSLTAQYMGSANYLESSPSAAVSVTVSAAPTITLLSAAPTPVSPTGQLTLLAQVLPNYNSGTGTTSSSFMSGLLGDLFGRGGFGGQSIGLPPTGTVTFSYTVGTGTSAVTTTLGTTTLQSNGRAALTVEASTLPTGASITASYSGDTNYAVSSSQADKPTVSSSVSAVRLSVKPSSAVTVNTAATLSITVGPGRSSSATAVPTGTVSLYDATTGAALTGSPVTLTAGTSNPATGSLPVTFTTPGLHLIIATYTPDSTSSSTYASQEVIIPIFVQGSGGNTGGTTGGGGGGGFGGWDDWGRHGRGW